MLLIFKPDWFGC